ncbi:MAG: pilus assembly protein [Hyphomonadaceae bacterium]|jgi:Flp pilus assembly protein TadG|nr:pilus assembly protein [Hyphomonadaceae bacterium]
MSARFSLLLRKLRRFPRARRGSAAIEFGLVAVPFFLLIFGLAEISMIGFAQTTLDGAVNNTARTIRTGQAQMSGTSAGQIKEQICNRMLRILAVDCDTNLYIDVRNFNSFIDANNAANNPINNGEFNDTGFGYQPGAPSSIVVVRAYYRWHVMTPMFEPFFQNISSGERIIVSTMMFRNEPYQ